MKDREWRKVGKGKSGGGVMRAAEGNEEKKRKREGLKKCWKRK